MKAPFLSVICPVYNYAQYVGRTMTSILSQEFGDFELIVVNDASTDNTDETVKGFLGDPRIIYLVNERNSGAYASMERASRQSRGRYLAAIAADDYYLPGAFLKLYLEVEKHPEVVAVYGKYYLVDKNGSVTNYLMHPGWHPDVRAARTSDLADLLRYDCYTGVTAAFMKAGLWEKYPFDKSLRMMTDYDHWLQLAEAGRPLLFLDDYVAAVRHHGEQISVGTTVITSGGQLSDQLTVFERYLVPRNYPRLAGYEADFARQLQGRIDAVRQFPEAAGTVLEQNKARIDAMTGRLAGIGLHGRKKAVTGPTVSVIVSTYNRPHLLTDAIDSICAQTFGDFEIVVVNDGGNDVEAVCAPYRDRAPITYVRHATNRGPAAARNSGIRVARGEYICYLDDDDIYYPDHIETLLTFLEEQGAEAAYADSYEALQKEMRGVRVTVKRRLLYSCEFDLDALLVNNLFPTLCMMHRRACIDKTGYFDETLTTHEDWEMWIRLAVEFKLRHIAKVTSEYRRADTGSNISSYNLADFAATRAIIYERYKSISSPEIRVLQQQAMNNTKIPVDVFMNEVVQMVEKGNSSGGVAYYDEHRRLYGTIPELAKFDGLIDKIRKKAAP